jgi:hypothetical protein
LTLNFTFCFLQAVFFKLTLRFDRFFTPSVFLKVVGTRVLRKCSRQMTRKSFQSCFNQFSSCLFSGKTIWKLEKTSNCYRLFSREHVVLARLLYPLCCSCCSCCWIVAHGIRSTYWYSKYQLVVEVPIGTQSTNWYSKYQSALKVPISIRSTNWYLKYQSPF